MIDRTTATNAELDEEVIRLDRGQVGAIDYETFLKLPIPPRQCLLAPWLPMDGLAMIHAPRGIGKTHIALGTAWAVATGTGFLKWKVPADVGTRRVLLLDGEMPACSAARSASDDHRSLPGYTAAAGISSDRGVRSAPRRSARSCRPGRDSNSMPT